MREGDQRSIRQTQSVCKYDAVRKITLSTIPLVLFRLFSVQLNRFWRACDTLRVNMKRVRTLKIRKNYDEPK